MFSQICRTLGDLEFLWNSLRILHSVVSCPLWVFMCGLVPICFLLCSQLSLSQVNCADADNNLMADDVPAAKPLAPYMLLPVDGRPLVFAEDTEPYQCLCVQVGKGVGDAGNSQLGSAAPEHFLKESDFSSQGTDWLWSPVNVKCLK